MQIQRSLAAPAPVKTEYEIQPAPALSKALARVLSATESKENEAEAGPSNAGLEEFTEDDNRPASKTQRFVAGIVPSMFKNCHVEITHQQNLSGIWAEFQTSPYL